MMPPSWLPPIPTDDIEGADYSDIFNFTRLQNACVLDYFDLMYPEHTVAKRGGYYRLNFINRFPKKEFKLLLAELLRLQQQDIQDHKDQVTRIYY